MNKESITYVIGAYGTNNIGDDAILTGLRKRVSTTVVAIADSQIDSNYINPGYLDTSRIKPKFNDDLIIGGGGIFHSPSYINYLKNISTKFLSFGGYQIRAVGLENLEGLIKKDPKVYDLCLEIFSGAKFISVRSSKSLRILNDIFGVKGVFEDDFSKEIKYTQTNHTKLHKGDKFVVGVILGGGLEVSDDLVNEMRYLTSMGVLFKIIPHSRSSGDLNNNDVITAEILSKKLNFSEDLLEVVQPIASLELLFEEYEKCDLIYSERLHGCYFALKLKLPLLCADHNDKLSSFYEDHKEKPSVYISSELSLVDFCINHTPSFGKFSLPKVCVCDICNEKITHKEINIQNFNRDSYYKGVCQSCSFSFVKALSSPELNFKSSNYIKEFDKEGFCIRTQLFIQDYREFIECVSRSKLKALDVLISSKGIASHFNFNNDSVVDVDLLSSVKMRGRFDLILVRNVLPHLNDWKTWIERFSKTLNAPGYIIVDQDYNGATIRNDTIKYKDLKNNHCFSEINKSDFSKYLSHLGFEVHTDNGRPIMIGLKNIIENPKFYSIFNSLYSRAANVYESNILCQFKTGFWDDEVFDENKYFRWTSEARVEIEIFNKSENSAPSVINVLMSNFPRDPAFKVYVNGEVIVDAVKSIGNYSFLLKRGLNQIVIHSDPPFPAKGDASSMDSRRLGLAINLELGKKI